MNEIEELTRVDCMVAETQSPQRDPRTRRILFVDDERILLKAFTRALRKSEYEVHTAGCAAEGLEAVKSTQFAVVVSDLRMPGVDGVAFLESVRTVQPEALRILVSGKGDFESVVELINRVGLFRFVVKPWDIADLRATIRLAVERYNLFDDNRRLNGLFASKCYELSELNANLGRQIQERTSLLLLGLMNALDLRDTDTQWHSRRVALYSRRLGIELGLEGEELLAVERGALLHDVGKIGVPDTILLKRGQLVSDERREIERHAEHGFRILGGIEFLGEAREIVRQHHEHFDGTGYPRGLAGDEIIMGARIFAVVDAYDAMTTDRSYRVARSHGEASLELEKMKATMFDPRVVEAWIGIPEEEITAIREQVNAGGGLD